MPVAGKDKVRVDLVREDDDTFFRTYLNQLCQFFQVPGSSHRIMGVREDYHFCGRGDKLPQTPEIHHPSCRCLCQVIIQKFTSVIFHCPVKRSVDGRLYDYLIVLTCVSQRANVECRDHPGTELYPFTLHRPAVAVGDPFYQHLKIALRPERVSKYLMFQSFSDCLNNKRWSFEIHISHPHGDDIGPAKDLFP